MKKEFNWMIVFWVCMIILFIWLILKELGYINTPDLVKIIPYLVGFGALIAMTKEMGKFAYTFGEYGTKINTLVEDMHEVKQELHSLDKRVYVLDKRVSILEINFQSFLARFHIKLK